MRRSGFKLREPSRASWHPLRKFGRGVRFPRRREARTGEKRLPRGAWGRLQPGTREKGKPAARWGRKAGDLPLDGDGSATEPEADLHRKLAIVALTALAA